MGVDGGDDPSADLRAWLGAGGRAMEDAGVLDNPKLKNPKICMPALG